MPFKIVIVGTGIAGLSAAIALADKGHTITILEATAKLQAVGGIIIVQANANRVLDQLGVYEAFSKICSVEPMPMYIRRYADGERLISQLGTFQPREYGYPMWAVHRADYQQVLHEATTKRKNITLHLGQRVAEVEENVPAVVTTTGKRYEGDIIVGADGDKSAVRKAIFPGEDAVRDIGLDVTRVNIPEALMRADVETSELMASVQQWFGPTSVIASVPIRRGNEWLVGWDIIHPRTERSANGTSRIQDVEKVKSYFNDYAPIIQKAFRHVTEAHVWRLATSKPKSWVSKSGRVVLTGDAAHAVLPFVGQGGGMALEDAVTLAECLERASDPASIGPLMKFYQKIREPRCTLVQDWSIAQKIRATLCDGPEQRERDAKMRMYNTYERQTPWDGVHIDELPDSLDAPSWRAWLLGHDAQAFVSFKEIRPGLN